MSLYLDHFGLNELPFRITPAVDFFYRGSKRGEILDAIKYAITNGEGILAVFGEVGSGKSVLCRVLMHELRNKADLVYVANPSLTDREIVYHIAEELELDLDGERHQIASALQSHLIAKHAQGHRTVVCVDEAQAMPDASLEQIRLLSNLETSREKLIQIVMFGQPELADKLSQQHMRQLRERITSSFTLRTYKPQEVRDYIALRLAAAGFRGGRELIKPAACDYIASVSQGISRRINILCDKAMLAAFAENSPVVKLRHAKLAARDARYRSMVYRPTYRPEQNRRIWKIVFASLVVAVAVVVTAFQIQWLDETDGSNQAAEVLAAAVQTNPDPALPSTSSSLSLANPSPSTPVSIAVDSIRVVVAPSAPSPEPARVVAPAVAVVAPAPTIKITLIDNQRWQSYPSGSYLRQRLNATQTLLKHLDTTNFYTARIITVPRSNAIEIEKFLRDIARFYSIRNVMVYPALAENEENFVITYGQYESEFQAELFVHEMPSFFRIGKPFAQALAVSQFEASNHW